MWLLFDVWLSMVESLIRANQDSFVAYWMSCGTSQPNSTSSREM